MKKESFKKVIYILLIILLVLISVFGINMRNGSENINLLNDYKLGLDIKGHREIKYNVSIREVNIEHEHPEGEEHSDDEEVEKVPVNTDESKTLENYNYSKNMLIKRLEYLNILEYKVRLNTYDGSIIVELPEDSKTVSTLNTLPLVGEFKVIDTENNEVLINYKLVKGASVLYSRNENNLLDVYLAIEFNEEGKEKLKEVSSKYIASTDEEGKDNSKTVTAKIDNNDLLKSTFGQTITDGILSIRIGKSVSDSETAELDSYKNEADLMAMLISKEIVPLEYSLSDNKYIISDININVIYMIILITFILSAIILTIRYKTKGIIASILSIGVISILSIIVRIMNITIMIESIYALIFVILINHIIIEILLNNKFNDLDKKINMIIKVFIPILIISILFTLNSWGAISSFGMVVFWGLFTSLIYNYTITRSFINLEGGGKVNAKK